jgi:hypothetical protein
MAHHEITLLMSFQEIFEDALKIYVEMLINLAIKEGFGGLKSWNFVCAAL